MFHFAFFKRKTLKRWLLLTTCQSQVDNAPKDLSMVHLDEIGISQQSKGPLVSGLSLCDGWWEFQQQGRFNGH